MKRIQSGRRVLDIACGTGVLALEVAARIGPDGLVVGLEPNVVTQVEPK